MIPVRDNQEVRVFPLITWTLIALNVLIFLWDRRGIPDGPNIVFVDFAMRPTDVIAAVTGRGDPFALTTLFTAMFLHANSLHLVLNMLYLLAFGPTIESALGPFRYALYFITWGLVAWAAHIYVEPSSPIPTLGASGAIGGVLGAYLLLFPASKIEFLFRLEASAWVFLGGWFLYQILIPQHGVANWAHAGGFLAGMLTVLVMGGRGRVLGTRREMESPAT